MFAVKGWSVDPASLKPQTEAFASSKPAKNGENQKSSKKRKRGYSKEVKKDTIRGEDVGSLWEQHIEGKEPPKTDEKRQNKKQKLEHGERRQNNQPEQQGQQSKKETGAETKHSEGSGLDGKAEKKDRKKKDKKSKSLTKEVDGEAEKPIAKPKDGSQQPSRDGIIGDTPALPLSAKLTPLQSAMRQKLVSARFRHLNQTLYTEPSNKAQELFNQNPEMFEDYHAGFRQQVSVWPENPVDKFIAEIRRRGKLKPPKRDKQRKGHSNSNTPAQYMMLEPLPRTYGTCILADLGCGDGRLAQTLINSGNATTLNLKLHSYDLHASSPHVTKADISDLPLKDGSVDVAIFCLALMGTNWISFVEEANRILHWKGELWIAEIKSRFGRVSRSGKPVSHSVGARRKSDIIKSKNEAKKSEQHEEAEEAVLRTVVDGAPTSKDETDVSAFVDVLKRRGFMLKPPQEKSIDLSNKMFVKMEFVKALHPRKGKGMPSEEVKEAKGAKKAKPKFIPEMEDEPSTEDEASVLKPCLYKIR